ncbi:MAG: NfeD family protein [Fibrobacterota bacterium]
MIYIAVIACQILASLLIVAELMIPSLGLLSMASAALFFFSYYLLYGVSPSLTPVLLLVNLFSVPAVIVYATSLISSSPAALKRRLESTPYFGRRTSVAVGEQGLARTMLRPVGKGKFSGGYFDVVAQSGLIEANTAIEVVSVDENRIVVREIVNES